MGPAKPQEGSRSRWQQKPGTLVAQQGGAGSESSLTAAVFSAEEERGRARPAEPLEMMSGEREEASGLERRWADGCHGGESRAWGPGDAPQHLLATWHGGRGTPGDLGLGDLPRTGHRGQ